MITYNNDDKLDLAPEVPPRTPKDDMEFIKSKAQKPVNRLAELEGKYKGQIWMADDFDAPLEDFAEYA